MGARIKIASITSRSEKSKIAPHKDARIKIINSFNWYKQIEIAPSHPSQVCGLKFVLDSYLEQFLTPFTGVRIKIKSAFLYSRGAKKTPDFNRGMNSRKPRPQLINK